jgi:hypothetical protein
MALILLWSRPECTFLTVVASAGASGLLGAPPDGPTRSQMCSVASSEPETTQGQGGGAGQQADMYSDTGMGMP